MFTKISVIIILAISCLVPLASAQPYAIKADRMLDVRTGKILSPAVIVIEQGKIKAINPRSLSKDMEIIELGDHTLLPGLIDARLNRHPHTLQAIFLRVTPGLPQL